MAYWKFPLVGLVVLVSVLPNEPLAHCGGKHGPGHPHCAGEPPPPPPPEPPLGDACVNVAGDFPAFAYKTEQTVGKRRKAVTTNFLHLADSTGTCTIEIWSSAGSDIDLVEFSFAKVNDGLARLALNTSLGGSDYAVRLMDVQLQGKAITSPLPLQPTVAYAHPDPVGSLGSAAISNDGSVIAFGSEERGSGEVVWLTRLWLVDVSTCTSNCPVESVRVTNNESFEWISVGADNQQIFYSQHKRIPDTYHVAMVQRVQGGWSEPVDIATSFDGGYADVKFHDTSLGAWDYAGTGASAVLSVVVELAPRDGQYVLDVFDIDNVGATQGGSCFATSDCPRAGTDLLGVPRSALVANFTELPGNSLDTPPNILIGSWRDASVEELDPDNPPNTFVRLQGAALPAPAR